MKKALLLLTSILIAFGADSDLDGVPDNIDQCPNTPFLELVNKNGCPKITKSKNINIHFNASIGYENDIDNSTSYDTYFASVGVYYNNYSLSYYYSILDSQSNDSIISFYYKKRFDNFKLKGGIKAYLPTDNNSELDYAFKVKGSYYVNDKVEVSLSEKHKIYGESGTNAKDTIMSEVGFATNRWYISPYAYMENSKYDSSDWNYYGGLFIQYNITKRAYLNCDYSHNLEEDISSIVTSIGYFY